MSFFLIGLLVGVAVFTAAVILPKCFVTVNQGHVVVLSSFGRALRDGNRVRTLPPGLHTKMPWQLARIVPTVEQSVELTGDNATAVMAKDGTVLRFDSHVRTRIDAEDIERWLFGVTAPAQHVTGLFAALVRNEIATFEEETKVADSDGSYAVLRRERKRLNEKLEKFSEQVIGTRYGVRFVGVDLVDVRPPDELAIALNAVMQARSAADAMYAHGEADARRRILAAEHGVAVAKKRAEATETEIATLGGFLAELDRQDTLSSYVARRRAEVLAQSRSLIISGG
jgi:regulator of protease activity HflC (stomatin/prohibitin superfamily)